MKSKIYALIAQAPSVLSGAHLSRELGVSRVAVWKHIRQMKESGCAIEATPRGYRLLAKSDIPFPWVFGDRAERIHYKPQVDSTMSEAMALAGQGCANFSVVVADRQTLGRGRLQRAWQSATGGLYFTMVLRPQIRLTLAPLINLAAAIDLAHLLRDYYGIEALVKWPNDVLVDGCKIAGILSQMSTEFDLVQFVNLGIGINVNNPMEHIDRPAVSLAQLKGCTVPRTELLELFLQRFEQRMDEGQWGNVVAQWRAISATLGRRVVIQTQKETLSGMAVDLHEDGSLIIETLPGQRRTLVYGDCFFENEPNPIGS